MKKAGEPIPSIATLVDAGLAGARLVFGVDGHPVAAGSVADRGTAWFDRRGDGAVGALLMGDQSSVEVLLGAIRVGATLVSLPLPGRGADPDAYLRFVRRACEEQGVVQVVVRPDIAPLLEAGGLPVRSHTDLRPGCLPSGTGDEFRLVQFSSGSTGVPKPIPVSDGVLGTNVEAIMRAVRPVAGDVTVSWLPLSHDMGLVGMLLTSLASGGPNWVGSGEIVLIEPEAFLRRPSIWLEAVARWRGTVTAAPDFAYRLAARRRGSDRLDLSSLRCAILGGEVIRADTLADFSAAWGPDGLDPSALCPAYGMAELGLAATLNRPGTGWRERSVSTRALSDRHLAAAQPGDPATTLVSSGPPLDGYGVVVDVDPPGIGRLSVRAPAVADVAGVLPGPGAPFGSGGILETGDLGFLDGDDLFVCGRLDDHVVVRGRTLYAPAIEMAVGDVDGVRSGRATAVGSPSGTWLLAVEADPRCTVADAALRDAVRRAASRVAGSRPDEIVVLAPGRLPMTASGKLQRHEVARRWIAGEL